ncbi:hypothetical protein MJH54_34240, partial [Salmonella enterica subsp. enterica serovar Montevideo]|nr:hypothetical protein [Salmonella enterica subsp. enterica serovar Montevideo]
HDPPPDSVKLPRNVLSILLPTFPVTLLSVRLPHCLKGYLRSYIFGSWEMVLGPFGYFLTLFAVWAAINAFNMVDGIDGLLGGL